MYGMATAAIRGWSKSRRVCATTSGALNTASSSIDTTTGALAALTAKFRRTTSPAEAVKRSRRTFGKRSRTISAVPSRDPSSRTSPSPSPRCCSADARASPGRSRRSFVTIATVADGGPESGARLSANMGSVSSPSTRKLRVVFLTHVARLSGAEIGLVRFVQAAEDIQAAVIVAEDGPLGAALGAAGAHVEVRPLAAPARDVRRSEISPGARQARGAAHIAAYVPRLAARLRAHRPHLVHAISLKAGVYGSLAARLARRPALWHLHDHL